MKEEKINYAFIDSQNLNLAIRAQDWVLDFKKFRIYLRDKYQIKTAYAFLGYVEGNSLLYKALKEAGFECIFKPTLATKDGQTKGNCDAELVLQAMIDLPEYDKAMIISGDGDFYCLAKYLIARDQLLGMMIPNRLRYSGLYKLKEIWPYLRFMNNLSTKLALKKEKTQQGRNLEG